jgi:hypothetical protein
VSLIGESLWRCYMLEDWAEISDSIQNDHVICLYSEMADWTVILAYSTETFRNFPSAKEKETYVYSSYVQHRWMSTRYCHVTLFIFVARLESVRSCYPCLLHAERWQIRSCKGPGRDEFPTLDWARILKTH